MNQNQNPAASQFVTPEVTASWVDRVKKERDEVNDRATALAAFLDSLDGVKGLEGSEKVKLMEAQLGVMVGYVSILELRLAEAERNGVALVVEVG